MGEPTGRVLGLDLGRARIGVAVSNSEQTVATPIEVVSRSDRAAAYRRISELVDEWEAEAVVVGLPLHLNGSRGAAAKFVDDEIAALGATIAVPIIAYDERLTTVTANRSLDEQNVPAAKRRTMVDMIAAAVILQSWMDRDRSHPDSGAEQWGSEE